MGDIWTLTHDEYEKLSRWQQIGYRIYRNPLIMFGIALPSTPGYVGAFELPIIAVLSLYGVDKSLAAAYALSYHVTTFLPITLLGAWSVARTNLGLTAFRRSQP